ncbi:MAG: hypothetical protein JJT88_10330 [Gammaproteobacteria bacterium]|nr:hypothetical protein [Gammaproteobacteria bacterium]
MFVIGAGRSGTSSLARGVSALGVDFGDNFKRPSRKNPSGFFEDIDLLRLSKAVRLSRGVRADSLRLIEPEELQGPELEHLRQRARRVIRQRFANSPVWGFKYGRTLRILPFWEPVLEALNMAPSFVLALRNPISVARSRAALDPRRGRQEASDLEWLVSVVPFLRRARHCPLVVVDYDLLMDAPLPQLERIRVQLGLPESATRAAGVQEYANAFLRAGFRHTRFDDADLDTCVGLNPLTRDAYRLLRRLAADELDAREHAFWDAWEDIERQMAAIAPLLRLLDLVESERRQAVVNPFSSLRGLARLGAALRR